MFERFTDRARRIVVLAQEEARFLGHNYIGTEHLLLALLRDGDGVAARALTELGVGLEPTRAEVLDIVGEGAESPSGHIPFTPRAKTVLELSLREALQIGHNYIGTEHILLGLVREGEGVACQILVKDGVDLSRVRQTVLGLAASTEADGPPPGSTGPFADFRFPGGPPQVERLLRSSPEFRPGRRDRPGGSGLSQSAAVFVLVAILAVLVERPPSALARVALGVVLVALAIAVVVCLSQLLPAGWRPNAGRRRGLIDSALTVATVLFGSAAGLLVVDALLS